MPNTKTAEKPALNPNYSDYWQRNIAIIPEYIKDFNWSCIYRENWTPDKGVLESWESELYHTYAIVTGSPSNIIAIDCDNVSDEELEAIQRAFPSECQKFGSRGVTLFYRYNNEKNFNFKKDGVLKVELLSTGRRTTIPPTKHKKTKKPYIWVNKSLLDAELTTLPDNYQEIIAGILGINLEPAPEYKQSTYDNPPSYNEAVEMLNRCNNNLPNADWVSIGMAFKSEVGDAGFQDFDNWSNRGSTYDKNTIRSRWRSFDSHSIGYGTLVHYAKDNGYRPQKEKIVKVTENAWEEQAKAHKEEALEESNEIPDIYKNAPHHIKEVCDWITSTAMYPQHTLTLGSVISFFGFLMGKDFEFNSLRTNLYVANIAYSADGKEHVNRCIRGMLGKADLAEKITYSFTSDTSIMNDLQKGGGRAFYLTDELQALLYSISKRSSNSAEGRAVSTLLQAYTGVEVRTVTKANMKENPTIIIKNPLVTICGYTTPHMFEQCLGTTEVLSGFVGRLSTFKGNKFIPDENHDYFGNAWKNVPENIIEIIKAIQSNRGREYLPDGAMVYGIKEIPTKFEDKIKKYREDIRKKRNDMRANNDPKEVIFGRAGEIMIKYAMIASQGKEILEEHIDWAIQVVDYNLSIILDVASNFADTNFERKKRHALTYIMKRGGQIEKSAFTKGCAIFDNARERNEIIKDLIDAGELKEIGIEGGLKPKTGYRVIANP